MDLQLDGMVFLVTGASAGIGEATVRLLSDEGGTVVGVARSPESIESIGRNVTSVAADLSEREAAQRVVDVVLERHGRLDGVVNNVGAVESRAGFFDVTDDDWHATFELNFHANVRMTRAALPSVLAQGGGSVVHIASEAARFPGTAIPDYSASKTAMLALSKTLAAEFSPHGIRSNVVSPGPTRTRLWDEPGGFGDQLADRFQLPVEEAIEHFLHNVRPVATGRLGRPADVARVIAYLLSPLASQITGSEWGVDGGSLPQL